MANCGRAHVIKAALVVGIVLVLLNFYNYRLDNNKAPTSLSMVNVNSQWPKRTHSSFEFSRLSHSDVVAPPSLHSAINGYGGNSNNVSTASSSSSVTNTTNNNNNATSTFSTNNTSSSIPIISKLNSILSNNTNSSQVILDNKISSDFASTTHSSASPVEINNITVSSLHEDGPDNFSVSTANSNFTESIVKLNTTRFNNDDCPPIPPNLDGPIEVNVNLESIEKVEHQFAAALLPGGWFKPKECHARDRVAIVIPYRDRATHLPIFLANIHPFLMKQQIEYGIFLIEQDAVSLFNRAALMNVGFVEALKMNHWDCFIFHDIDLLPMDDRNLYTCPDQPRHMSVAVNTLGFRLPYSSLFGGVSAMTVEQFKAVNGYSNSFWGWGGEDDDMSNRLKHVGYYIARYPVNIARYTMLSHRKEKPNPKRFQTLVNGAKKYDVDGLSSLKYQVHYLEKKPLYTWLIVEIKEDSGS